MIEDQVSPNRCGNVVGKSVLSFDVPTPQQGLKEAIQRH